MRATLRQLRHRMRKAKPDAVTLIIYGWRESQPGTLAWVFPSLRSALRGVRAMRNAIAWCVVKGRRTYEEDFDVDALRRGGAVLIESGA
jgi:hypothetical protein